MILVSAGVLLWDKQGRLLLQRRTDNKEWSIPGGCMELGETTEETALREVHEETGLTIASLLFFGVFSGAGLRYIYPNGDKVEVVSIVYETADFSGELRLDEDESLELRFFPILEIALLPLTSANKTILSRFL